MNNKILHCLALALGLGVPNISAQPTPPYIGVSYYPEVAGDQIDGDIAKMKSIGVNLVRFGDFSWSRMETNAGQYDFAWMHRAADKFANAGIAVELCTPTAAPPVWLSAAHPDILRVNAYGLTVGHGGRRQYCPNSKTYRHYACDIAAQLGRELGNNPKVVAWQIDNEFWEECFCTNCEREFHSWLKKRYGTIENLNDEWLTVLWSQEYQSFDQVPLPNPQRVGAGHHPSLVAAYRHFMSDSYVSFCAAQVQVLRRYTRQPITTTAHNPVYQRIDYADLFCDLDLVGVDCYAGPDNLLRYAFEANWMRPLGKPFWLAETAVTHSAGTAVGNQGDFANSPGAMRAKMWLTYALGGEAVSFWLWRAHWAGQELEHGSLIYPWGDECANTTEIRQVAAELKKYSGWLRTTKPLPATVALEYGVPTQWLFEATPIAAGFNYDDAITGFHRLLVESGAVPDVIMPGKALNHYKVVFSPYAPASDDATLKRLKNFVEQGGTWVLGPLSASRTVEATAHRDACYGLDFENWLGIHVRHRLPPGGVTKLSTDQGPVGCRWWCDAYETTKAQRVLAKYTGGPLAGFAAVVECAIGKGRVIVVGTQPDDAWLKTLIARVVPANDREREADAGVMVVPRVDAKGQPAGTIVINTRPAPAQFRRTGEPRQPLGGYAVQIEPAKN